jgi:hypothetical protein
MGRIKFLILINLYAVQKKLKRVQTVNIYHEDDVAHSNFHHFPLLFMAAAIRTILSKHQFTDINTITIVNMSNGRNTNHYKHKEAWT